MADTYDKDQRRKLAIRSKICDAWITDGTPEAEAFVKYIKWLAKKI